MTAITAAHRAAIATLARKGGFRSALAQLDSDAMLSRLFGDTFGISRDPTEAEILDHAAALEERAQYLRMHHPASFVAENVAARRLEFAAMAESAAGRLETANRESAAAAEKAKPPKRPMTDVEREHYRSLPPDLRLDYANQLSMQSKEPPK